MDALGLSITAFATAVGMEPAILGEMLAGRASIDVPAAVRIARALQLPAERIMKLQIRYDFSVARDVAELQATGPLAQPTDPPAFPSDHLTGFLGYSSEGAGAPDTFFFREQLAHRITGDDYAGLHALWPGDRLRIVDPTGALLWMGPILEDLEGRVWLPYTRREQWQSWFVRAYRADLAMAAEHVAYVIEARGA